MIRQHLHDPKRLPRARLHNGDCIGRLPADQGSASRIGQRLAIGKNVGELLVGSRVLLQYSSTWNGREILRELQYLRRLEGDVL